MKPTRILQPTSIDDVCRCLTEFGDEAALHAGGTDLLVRMRAGSIAPRCIIDLGKVESLRGISDLPSGGVRIRAMATLADVAAWPTVQTRYRSVCEAVASIGSVQIRNRGTLAGNICNASPAADSVPALLVCDASLNLRSLGGTRTIELDRFITGPGETDLRKGEFLESIDLPPVTEEGASAFFKLGRRKAVDCAIVSVAVRVTTERRWSVAFGAVAAVPFRAASIESMLSGVSLKHHLVEQAERMAVSLVQPIDDVRASKEYRAAMAAVLLCKALARAQERVGNLWDHG